LFISPSQSRVSSYLPQLFLFFSPCKVHLFTFPQEPLSFAPRLSCLFLFLAPLTPPLEDGLVWKGKWLLLSSHPPLPLGLVRPYPDPGVPPGAPIAFLFSTPSLSSCSPTCRVFSHPAIFHCYGLSYPAGETAHPRSCLLTSRYFYYVLPAPRFLPSPCREEAFSSPPILLFFMLLSDFGVFLSPLAFCPVSLVRYFLSFRSPAYFCPIGFFCAKTFAFHLRVFYPRPILAGTPDTSWD